MAMVPLSALECDLVALCLRSSIQEAPTVAGVEDQMRDLAARFEAAARLDRAPITPSRGAR